MTKCGAMYIQNCTDKIGKRGKHFIILIVVVCGEFEWLFYLKKHGEISGFPLRYLAADWAWRLVPVSFSL